MAAECTGRKWYLVEALGLAALVGMYIWKWQMVSPRSWWIVAAWMVLSGVLRRDTPKTLGWRADNLWAATRRAVLFFGVAVVAVCELPGVLFAAAGGAEFVFDEPVAGLF